MNKQYIKRNLERQKYIENRGIISRIIFILDKRKLKKKKDKNLRI